MAQRCIMTPDQLTTLTAWLAGLPMPFTVSVNPGRLRTLDQNALVHKWFGEVAHQRGDMTPSEIKCEAKAYFGVPILLAEDAEFAETYNRVIKPLARDVKLQAMHILPVTSRMTTKQLTRFMDEVYRHYSGHGFILTQPEPIE